MGIAQEGRERNVLVGVCPAAVTSLTQLSAELDGETVVLVHGGARVPDLRAPVSARKSNTDRDLAETMLLLPSLSISLRMMPREELLALQQPELWPLVVLAKEPPDRLIMNEMCTDLAKRRLENLLLPCNAAATRRLKAPRHFSG